MLTAHQSLIFHEADLDLAVRMFGDANSFGVTGDPSKLLFIVSGCAEHIPIHGRPVVQWPVIGFFSSPCVGFVVVL